MKKTAIKNSYEPYILQLLTVEGYIAYYHRVIADYSEFRDCNRRAWEATERAHLRYFNKAKYTSYQSFKTTLGRFNKQKIK